MKRLVKKVKSSVMNYITLSLTAILSVALLSIFLSIWMTEQTENDAQAINTSGSMRMLTYRIGLALEQNNQQKLQDAISQLEQTWQHNTFQSVETTSNVQLKVQFKIAQQYWLDQLKPLIDSYHLNQITTFPNKEIETQIKLIDQLVSEFQADAEQKIVYLRLIQLIAMFSSILIGSIIFHLLKNRIEQPLAHLTQAAYKIGEGDFQQRVEVEGEDELSLLGDTLNHTTHSIATMYGELETRVEEKTRELQHRNTSLELLIDISKGILANPFMPVEYNYIVERLTNILEVDCVELCLFNEGGDRPYLQIVPETYKNTCVKDDCSNCANGVKQPLKYYLNGKSKPLGLITVRLHQHQILEPWQEQLTQSVADQLAICLSMNEYGDRDRRLTLMAERNIIARELHDSLAQSLSYLQIQVSRLQKMIDQNKTDRQQPVVNELREGLSSAYQSLRDLLTTFRLKISEGGLKDSVEEALEVMRDRTEMDINFDYQIMNIPLRPMEEIHLLQIIREATQNAIKHSKGSTIEIGIKQTADNEVALDITDNGVGLPDKPEKLNHYGLAIMQERSKQLAGDISISRHNPTGTKVSFKFTPEVFEAA